MSRFWPHSQYAEDQPYHRAILRAHVSTRAFQAGSILGLGAGTAIVAGRYFNFLKSPAVHVPAYHTLLRSTGVGAIIMGGIVTVGLIPRMWNAQEIEWKDRSWRLLENKAQVRVDDFTYGWMLFSLPFLANKHIRATGWQGMVGTVGAASVLWLGDYLLFSTFFEKFRLPKPEEETKAKEIKN
jgi:hypothetical protein